MEAEVTSVLGGDAVGQASPTWGLSTHVVRHRRFGVEHVALLGDVVVLLAAYTALVIAFEVVPANAPNVSFWHFGLVGAWLFVAHWRPFDRSVLAHQFQSAYGAAQNTLLAGAIFFLLPLIGGPSHSRISNLFATLVLASATAAWRVLLARVVSVPTDELVVVGAQWEGQTLADAIHRRPQSHLRIIAFVDSDPNLVGGSIQGVPVHPLSELSEVVRRPNGLARVVLATPTEGHLSVFAQLGGLAECGVEVVQMSTLYEQVTGSIPVRYLGSHWWALLPRPSRDALYWFAKRTLDVVLSIAGLCVLALLLPLLWPLLRLHTGGSAMFKQVRVGKHGQTFTVYKLRTLPVAASQEAGWRERKAANHPTRFCAAIRAIGLDELPQLINVLRGEMALVGPRPYVLEEVIDLQKSIPFFRARALVRPGLTGWAQINYGYGLSYEDEVEKLQHDLYYIGHQSTYLDLLIMLRTLTLVLRGKRPASRVSLSALPASALDDWLGGSAVTRGSSLG